MWYNNGRWDDFLAAWYGPLTPTVGQLCQAAPPALTDKGILSLTLVVTPQLVGADLAWTPHGPAHHYNLYVLHPDGTTWELLDAVPAGQTTYHHREPLLPSGVYLYRVAAHDAPGNVLALSGAAGGPSGITGLVPNWSYWGEPAAVAITSRGFVTPFTVTLGGVVVTYEQTGPEQIIVVVPAGLGVGLYHLAAATPEGQTILYDAFRVREAVERIYLPVVFR